MTSREGRKRGSPKVRVNSVGVESRVTLCAVLSLVICDSKAKREREKESRKDE
jgi:hypothetical protein